MASSHIISWHIEREKVETMAEFIFLAPKALWMVNCSHKNKRRLLLGIKAILRIKLRLSIKKQRHYFADKGLYS